MNELFLTSLLGLTEEDAVTKIEADGTHTSRIRIRDGESFMGDCSVKMNRVNLHVEKDLVVKAYFG